MALFSFGKKQMKKKRLVKKPPSKVLRICRRLKIKTTKKVGSRRVYKSLKVLKKQIKLKVRKMHKRKSHHRRKSSFGAVRRSRARRSGFGEVTGYAFNPAPVNYGYNEPVQQYPQALSQTSTVSNEKINISRPEGMGVPETDLPVYGVYRNFFGQDVPTQIPPNWNFMGQPDGGLYPVGAPFERYTKPIAFGKKKSHRRRRYNVSGSPCNKLSKRVCHSNPNCSYTKRGCKRRSGTKTKGLVFEGPSLEFGARRRRRHYNVSGSPCNKLRKRVCRSNPNCSYTKRGCKRRSGTKTKGLVFEGPSLAFGKKRRVRNYNVAGSSCNHLSERVCQSNPNCSYTKRGCRRRSGTKTKGLVFEGPSLEFGKKRRVRRYNVAGSACNKLSKRVCHSNPNCSYTKRGCKRRSGTKTKGLVFEGPSLAFGKKKNYYM